MSFLFFNLYWFSILSFFKVLNSNGFFLRNVLLVNLIPYLPFMSKLPSWKQFNFSVNINSFTFSTLYSAWSEKDYLPQVFFIARPNFRFFRPQSEYIAFMDLLKKDDFISLASYQFWEHIRVLLDYPLLLSNFSERFQPNGVYKSAFFPKASIINLNLYAKSLNQLSPQERDNLMKAIIIKLNEQQKNVF